MAYQYQQAAGDTAALAVLADPTRRALLDLLRREPLPVGELARRMPVSRPAVSKHLRLLSTAGLVEHTPRGTRNLYALAPAGFTVAQQWLVEMWDDVLAAYAEAVADSPREP